MKQPMLQFVLFCLVNVSACKHERQTATVQESATSAELIVRNRFENIPATQLPFRHRVINLQEMMAYDDGIQQKSIQLLDSNLAIRDRNAVWQSEFWEPFFNGIAARWQRGKIYNFFNYDLYQRHRILQILIAAQNGDRSAQETINQLSPTEKYDLLVGNYYFPTTIVERALRGRDKDQWPAWWAGYCNGVAAAAIQVYAPLNGVTAVNRDGFEIKFTINDMKALWALSYMHLVRPQFIGNRCRERFPETDDDGRAVNEACRDLNPATFVVALINYIGIIKKSFVLDIHEDKPVWNFPILASHIALIPAQKRREKLLQKHPQLADKYPQLAQAVYDLDDDYRHGADNAQFLVDIQIVLDLSDVGAHPQVPNQPLTHHPQLKKTYFATLELNHDLELVGGEWTRTKGDSPPDFAWFPTYPNISRAGFLWVNQATNFNVLRWIGGLSRPADNGGRRDRNRHLPPNYHQTTDLYQINSDGNQLQGSRTIDLNEIHVPMALRNDDNLRFMNWRVTSGNVLKIVGRIEHPNSHQAVRASIHGGGKQWSLSFHNGYFLADETWYFWNPKKFHLVFYAADNSIVYQSSQFELKQSDPGRNRLHLPYPIHQRISKSRDKKRIESVFLLPDVSFSEANKPVHARIVAQSEQGALSFISKTFDLHQQAYSNRSFTLVATLPGDTTTYYIVLFDKRDSQLSLVPTFKNDVDRQAFEAAQKSGRWQKPARRTGTRKDLFESSSFRSYYPLKFDI